MTQRVSLDLWSVCQRSPHHLAIYRPLLNLEQINYHSHDQLADEVTQYIQKGKLDRGDYRALVYLLPQLTPEISELAIQITREDASYLHTDLEITIPVIDAQLTQGGCFSVSPTLKTFVYAPTYDESRARLREAIKITLKHRGVCDHPQDLLRMLMWDEVDVRRAHRSFTLYSPSELEDLRKRERASWLSHVASPLKRGEYDGLMVGQRESLEQLIELEESPIKRSVLVLGPRGVGKSELIRYWAHTHARGAVWATSATRLIRQLTNDSGWQSNLAMLIRELEQSQATLYITNCAELFEVGRYVNQSLSIGELLRDEVSEGRVRIITECSERERADIELRYPGALSAYLTVELTTPKGEALKQIIEEKVRWLGARAQPLVEFDDESLAELISLHQRFMPYSGFPVRPLSFAQSLISRVTTRRRNHDIKHLMESGFTSIQAARAVEEEYHEIGDELEPTLITRASLTDLFCEESGLPPSLITPERPFDPDRCRASFEAHIAGQPEATQVIVDCISALKSGLNRPHQPIASLLFVGPTGVGKTEMVKVLTRYIFSSEERMIRFDMSEFSDPVNVMRLTGLRRGDQGLLTKAVRDQPFSVVLFDEVEKAHPDFFDLLLQIMGAGRLSDRDGETVDFCSAIVIMTSNLGAGDLKRGSTGFRAQPSGDQDAQTRSRDVIQEHFESAVRRALRPEIYNRIDRVVPFSPLSEDVISDVLKRELNELARREGLRFRDHTINYDDRALHTLSERGYNAQYGARHLQRVVRASLIYPLARHLNAQSGRPLKLKVSAETKLADPQVRSESDRRPDPKSDPKSNPKSDSKSFATSLMIESEAAISDLTLTKRGVGERSTFVELVSDLRRATHAWINRSDLSQLSSHRVNAIKSQESLRRLLKRGKQPQRQVKEAIRELDANRRLYDKLLAWSEEVYRETYELETEVTRLFLEPQTTCQIGVDHSARFEAAQSSLGRLMRFTRRYLGDTRDRCRVRIVSSSSIFLELTLFCLYLARSLDHQVMIKPIFKLSEKRSKALSAGASGAVREFDEISRSVGQELQRLFSRGHLADLRGRLKSGLSLPTGFEGMWGVDLELIGFGAYEVWRSPSGIFEFGLDEKERCHIECEPLTNDRGGRLLHGELVSPLERCDDELRVRELTREVNLLMRGESVKGLAGLSLTSVALTELELSSLRWLTESPMEPSASSGSSASLPSPTSTERTAYSTSISSKRVRELLREVQLTRSPDISLPWVIHPDHHQVNIAHLEDVFGSAVRRVRHEVYRQLSLHADQLMVTPSELKLLRQCCQREFKLKG